MNEAVVLGLVPQECAVAEWDSLNRLSVQEIWRSHL